jgi:hypothetical protein
MSESPFFIEVIRGQIHPEAILGRIEKDHFVLYITTREKYASAEVICSGALTQIALFAGENTRRFSLDGKTSVPVDANEPQTLIELPGGWEVGVSTSKYTISVTGVRYGNLVSLQFAAKDNS